MCLTMQDTKFIKLCDQFPTCRSFLITRGLDRRNFLQHIRKELIKVLELDKQENDLKTVQEAHP